MKKLLLAAAVISSPCLARAAVKADPWINAISNTMPRPTTTSNFGMMAVRLPRISDPAERDAVMLMIADTVKSAWAAKNGAELNAEDFARRHSDDAKRDVAKAIIEQMERAEAEAKARWHDYMLLSWYDRDRDFEAPQHVSECHQGGAVPGYVDYGIHHGATLKVDVEDGRFVFFYRPVEL